MLKYKGYTGNIEVDIEAGILYGKVLDLRDVITFQGKTIDEVQQAFKDSIDDYLEFCAERGEDPEKPFSGNFMVRIPPTLHRSIVVRASLEKKSLNQWMVEAITAHLTLITNEQVKTTSTVS